MLWLAALLRRYKMDWLTIIQTVGFPIASFFVAVFGIKYVYDRESEKSEKVSEKVTTLADAVYENTKILTVLVEEIKDLNNKED